VLAMVGIMAAILIPVLNKPSKTTTLARNDGRKLGLTDELNSAATIAAPEAAPATANTPATPMQHGDQKAAGERKPGEISLSNGRQDVDRVLTPADPQAAEKKLNLAAAAPASLQNRELAKAPSSRAPPDRAEADNTLLTRRYGLEGNLSAAQG